MPAYNTMSFAHRFDTVHAYYNSLHAVPGPFLPLAQAVLDAGIAIMPLFKTKLKLYAKDGREITPEQKEALGSAFCTEADRVSHEVIEKWIAPNANGIPILYEESTEKFSGSTFIAIDEIDGSNRFFHGEPGFMILAQYIREGQPVLSINYNPLTEHLYYAVQGQGSYKDGVRIDTLDKTVSMSTARVLLTNTDFFSPRRQEFLSHMQAGFEKRLECRLATGSRMAAVLDSSHHACVNAGAENLHVWDLGMYLNITEAGGTVTHLDGSPIIFSPDELITDFVCAANPELNRELQEYIEAWRTRTKAVSSI